MTTDTDRTAYQSDVLDPARAQALQATLGITPDLDEGDPLTPFFHQIYFWNGLTPSQLGRDGHPARGLGIIPDLGLPRRMWAGGRLEFHEPCFLGQRAECVSRLLRVEEKQGRTGRLALLTLQFDYSQDDMLCIREERDLIYREDPGPEDPKPAPPIAQDLAETSSDVKFSTTDLFRYSALTFNGHRIHYDLNYAQAIENYEGLVVHGPLLAQVLMLKAEAELGPLAQFTFRASAPLLHYEGATLQRAGTTLWVEGPKKRLCMKATAVPK